jgi:hypothetical protein
MDKKYLKYKSKYISLKNKMKQLQGGAPKFTTINKAKIKYLFRCAPSIENIITYEDRLKNSKHCKETDKIGLYFATKAIMSLAICIEYNKLMDLIVFEVTEDIEKISIGKYEFREINHDRYFTPNDEFIQNTKILPEENVSHIDCNINLLNNKKDQLLPPHIEDSLSCLGSCEIFLSTLNPDHLRNLKVAGIFRFDEKKISPIDLLRYMEENHFPFNLDKYIHDKILFDVTSEYIKQ